MKFRRTELQAEEYAYPNGGQKRKGKAIYPDMKVRTVWGGIPDTYFSIPAHGRLNGRYVSGWLGTDDADGQTEIYFHIYTEEAKS